MPAVSAMHGPLDHEHGRRGICFFWITLILSYALGRRRGIRVQRARQADIVDEAFTHLDRLQQSNERHEVQAQMMRDEINAMRKDLQGLEHECRSANVMAIMMSYQINQIHFMTGRIDRLRSSIANHQMPCPLGDNILVQENLDGADWYLDPDCPILQLNRTPIYELNHCQHCAPRDMNMVQDRAFTGR
eukprot:s1049_g18.t1